MARRNQKTHRFGDFEVKSSTICASDPCYKPGTWCALKVQGVQPGTWQGGAITWEEGFWGERVGVLFALHERAVPQLNCKWTHEGNCGVDAGLFGFYDDPPFRRGQEKMFDLACGVDVGRTVLSAGVVSSSGLGDGTYPVYSLQDCSGNVVAVVAMFLSDGENEDEMYTSDQVELGRLLEVFKTWRMVAA